MGGIKINIQNNIPAKLKAGSIGLIREVDKALDNFGLNTVADAQRNAPINEGLLRNRISYKRALLEVEIIVAVNYAAYLEFGTRRFAAEYVNSLPAEWQTFAAQFRGKGGGSFAELVKAITQWVLHKGIAAETTKSGNRSKSKSSLEAQKQAAYLITRKILIEGIRPQPFLIPAVERNLIELKKILNNLVK